MYELWNGDLFIHFTVYEWSHSIYKQCKALWANFLKRAKDNGFDFLYTIIPDDDPLVYKFVKKFGFKEETRVDGKIIMSRYL